MPDQQSLGRIRSRKIQINTIAMFAIKGISMLIGLMYFPLLLNTLNSVNYGIWLTLTSIATWCSMFDIGLGNGLRNKLSEALAKHDYKAGKIYVSTAYMAIFTFIVPIITVFLLISNGFLSWNEILNAPDIPGSELSTLVNIVFIAFGGQFALSLINSILFALQMPALSSFITMLGQLLSFVLIYLGVTFYGITSIVTLCSVIAFTPVAVLLCTTIIIFQFRYREIAPSVGHIRVGTIRDILSLGIKFFILQIAVLMLYQTNNLIITNVLSPEYVVEYNVAFKYISIVYMVFSIIITPIWSATTEAYCKNDIDWIRLTIRKITRIFWLSCLCIIVMVVCAPYAYKIWIGDRNIVNPSTTIAMAFYIIGQMAYGIYGYIINGTGKISLLVLVNVILAILYIPLAVLSADNLGLVGICLCSTLVNVVLFVVSKIQNGKLLAGTARGIWNK